MGGHVLTLHPRRPAIARSGMVSRSGCEFNEQAVFSRDSSDWGGASDLLVGGAAMCGFDFANSRIDLYSVAK